jgi:hypothetical protein
MLCYRVFTAAANSALETAMETIRAVTSTPDVTTYAYSHALRRSKTCDAKYQLCQLDLTFPLYPSNPTSTPPSAWQYALLSHKHRIAFDIL